MNQPEMIRTKNGNYVVFNGWLPNGRRRHIFSTYVKSLAEKELESRLLGNEPKIKYSNG